MKTTFFWFLSVGLRLKRVGLIAFLILTRIVTTASEAQAVNIKLKQAPPTPPPTQIKGGSGIGGEGQGDIGSLPNPAILPVEQPGTTPQIIGQGKFVDTIRAAANCWEQAIGTDDNSNSSIPDQLTLDIGVAQFGVSVTPPITTQGSFGSVTDIDGLLAVHGIKAGQIKTLSDGTSVFRETEGTIIFNDDPNAIFYASPTSGSSEYGNLLTFNPDLGGGAVNVSRQYNTPLTTDAANGYDLFTVAMHEIGHALGVSAANPAAIATLGSGSSINIQNPYPSVFANSQINTTYHNPLFSPSQQDDVHLANVNAVEYPTIQAGTRKLLTGADILGVAGISKYKNVNLSACNFNPQPTTLLPGITSVPESSTLPALLIGGGAVLVSRRRWRGKDDSF